MVKLLNHSLLFVLVLLLAGCSEWDDLVDSISGSGDDEPAAAAEAAVAAEQKAEEEAEAAEEKEEEEEEEESPERETIESDRFHHYSSDAWELGTAVAMVFCYHEPSYEWCELNGSPMNLHGVDEGRDVWAIYGEKGLSGEIVCELDGELFSFEVTNSGMQYGDCD